MRQSGIIEVWKDEQGFGFIRPGAGGDRVFAHIKDFPRSDNRPVVNQQISYTLMVDEQGRKRAANIRYAGQLALPLPVCLVLLFWLVLVIGWLVGKIPMLVLAACAMSSLVAFIAYAVDKRAAQKGQWRTPESTLHFWSLIGGWTGAVAAQQILRHKSQKQSFQRQFWATVIINILLLSAFILNGF